MLNSSRISVVVLAVLVLCTPALFAQAILTADGHTPAYTQFQNVMGVMPENPDCSHPSFGPHITQTTDNVLGVPVFVFNMHVTPDNDRCINTDRQRLEAKTDTGSPDALKGFDGDTMTYQWKFRLPAGFQSSSHFTHIHQIKGGLQPAASGAPVITLTTRAGSPDQLQLIYQTGAVLAQTALTPFFDTWVVVTEKVKVSTSGTYSIVIKTVDGGQTLLSYSNSNINMFPTQTGAGFIRPKWGIYRSLLEASALRDEQMHFNEFCVAKAPLACPGGQATPNFSLAASGPQTVTAGAAATYTASVTPSNGFNSAVGFSVSGLPSGATSSFNPASVTGSGSSTLTVSTSSSTPAGTYTLTITGTSGSLSHSAQVTLTVNQPVIPDFSLSASPAAVTVAAGSAASSTVTVSALNGFAGSVALSASSLPTGVTASFSPGSVTGAGSSTITISTSSSALSGTITITGTSGSTSHTTAIQVTVTAANVCAPVTPADGAWHNTAFASHSGTFTASFDAQPSVAKESAAVGLSHGAQTAYSGFANLVVFTTSGTIQARNGGAYAAASTINFSAGVNYHFRLAINVSAHTYSIFVTPAGGSEVTVGSNYAFRTEQNTVTSLDHWGALVNTTPGGTLEVCNFTVQ
jgi:hypothetical protein